MTDDREPVPIYRWTTLDKALSALRTDRVQAARWSHHLADEDRMAKGSSWSLDPAKWSQDMPVCLVADRSEMENAVHPLPGSRNFWRTLGMVNPEADPNAWTLEPEELDEEFVEGTIRGLSRALCAVLVRNLPPEGLSAIETLAADRGVRVGSADEALDAAGPRAPSA